MRRAIAYFKYFSRHKFFVLQAGLMLKCSLFRLIMHDMSKLKPSEFIPYSKTFYDAKGKSRFKPDPKFDEAWLLHQHRNPHHWEHWILTNKDGSLKPVNMPYEYIEEMVADWAGAGRAIAGKWEFNEWYDNNKDKMIMTDWTRSCVEELLLVLEHEVKQRKL